jgi:3-deoxy-manno-octulosonate cytidylyltransferase (CMP-KDO synthetase)
MATQARYTAVVIPMPARLASSRLQGKLMADIGGQLMLRHVFDAAWLLAWQECWLTCSGSPLVLL